MKPKVYIDTTVLSYLAAPPSKQPVKAARQFITTQWWQTERHKYTLVDSEAVEAECRRGNVLLAERLVAPCAIPEKAGPDAVHIAAASIQNCEFLLPWNFRHLAKNGYYKTTICTPEELV